MKFKVENAEDVSSENFMDKTAKLSKETFGMASGDRNRHLLLVKWQR